MEQDKLLTVLAFNGYVRAYACRTTSLVREICERHDTWPSATIALGRALSAGVMMGGMLKAEQQQIALEIKGDGPIGAMMIDAKADGTVRGYVRHPHVGHPPGTGQRMSVGEVVGREGFLHILRDMGMRDVYRGTVPLMTGEIGADLTYYFAQSEQTPSAVGVGVLLHPSGEVSAAGGFILQIMPGASEAVIQVVETQLAQADSITAQIEEGRSIEDILQDLLGTDFQILEERPLSFACSCTRERVESALVSVGREEMQKLIYEDGKAEIFCDFCRERYDFNKSDLQDILGQIQSGTEA